MSPLALRGTTHAFQRAQERFGLLLRRADMEAIAEGIEDGTFTPMGNYGGDLRSYLVEVDDARMFAIVSPASRLIVTFLTEDMWRETRARRRQWVARERERHAYRVRCRNGKLAKAGGG